ncbi:MAG: peptidase, partial [Tidjanibacter sp.]|nr:peptidase [Tidjanibacter sp.]
QMESITTQTAPIDETTPIVVLVDNSSASAAEIVSGALQDYDRAVLVGQRTYGKGLVQTTIPMGYNSYMKMTTAKYHLPSGRCIQALDYAAHNGERSVKTVPDSLIQEFRTSLGRKVYDGGGVMPDVKVEPEYVSSFAVMVYAQGFVDDFITDYCARHYDELEGAIIPTEYHFSDEGYEEFVAFMADKKVEWESYANRLWREFKKAAEKERWEESMTAEMAEIERKITNDTQDNLRLYKNELQKVIENQLVSRYCYSEGASAHMLRDDDELAVAIELLQNPERYNTIRTSQDTEKN